MVARYSEVYKCALRSLTKSLLDVGLTDGQVLIGSNHRVDMHEIGVTSPINNNGKKTEVSSQATHH